MAEINITFMDEAEVLETVDAMDDVHRTRGRIVRATDAPQDARAKRSLAEGTQAMKPLVRPERERELADAQEHIVTNAEVDW